MLKTTFCVIAFVTGEKLGVAGNTKVISAVGVLVSINITVPLTSCTLDHILLILPADVKVIPFIIEQLPRLATHFNAN